MFTPRVIALSACSCLCVVACGGGGGDEASEPATTGPAFRPDIVLITIDTLRADHLELYGHDRATAPALDSLAGRGVTFTQAISQAPWTLPSMASLHTSLYPTQHGAIVAEAPIAQEAPRLAELLTDEGYITGAVISHFFLTAKYGFHRGFARFDARFIAGHDAVTSDKVTQAAAQMYRDLPGDQPRFLWAHYFDPHFSYIRHEEYGFADAGGTRLGDHISYKQLGGRKGRRLERLSDLDYAHVRNVYDEEIRYTDHWIGQLIEQIDSHPEEREVVYVVTADHGEMFGERDRFGHGKDVYQELVNVPLLIAGDLPAELQGRRVQQPVEIAWVPTTLCSLLQIEGHPFRGLDLLSLEEQPGDSPESVFCEGNYALGEDERKVCVIWYPWKLTRHRDDGRVELYHLADDPGELEDLSENERAGSVRQRLESAVERFLLNPAFGDEAVDVSADEREHLRKLGYTDD